MTVLQQHGKVGHEMQGEKAAKKESDAYNRLVEGFLQKRVIQGACSIPTLRHGLGVYSRWLSDCAFGFAQLRTTNAEDFRADLATMSDPDGTPHYTAKSVAMILWAVKAFYSYLVSEGILMRNPFADLAPVKLPSRIPRRIPDAAKLFAALDHLACFWEEEKLSARRSRYRTHVAAEILYATGMRLGELGSLTEDDIDLDARIIHIRNGKGGVARTAYLNEYASKVLKIYLSQMREVVAYRKGRDTVLCTKAGNSIGGILNGNLVKYLGLHTHDFRHAVGTHLLQAGCDLRLIQLILGHEDLKSTAIYTKVAREDLRHQLDRYHPRGGDVCCR